MKRFVISILSVVILFFVFDFGFGIALDKLNSFDKLSTINYAMNADSCANILFFGSSKCHCGYNPEIIESELGYSAHNYGIEGQNIYMDYFLVDAVLANSKVKPKLIVVDLTYFDILDCPLYNKEKIRPLYKYCHNSYAARELVTECDLSDQVFSYMSKLYCYNQSVTSIISSCISKTKLTNGYEPKKGSYIGQKQDNTYRSTSSYDSSKEQYLNKLITLCDKNNVKIVFAVSPFYITDSCNMLWVNKLKQVVSNKNKVLLDYSQEKVFISHPEWFWDTSHLNNVGADYYSIFVADKLRQYL